VRQPLHLYLALSILSSRLPLITRRSVLVPVPASRTTSTSKTLPKIQSLKRKKEEEGEEEEEEGDDSKAGDSDNLGFTEPEDPDEADIHETGFFFSSSIPDKQLFDIDATGGDITKMIKGALPALASEKMQRLYDTIPAHLAKLEYDICASSRYFTYDAVAM
jgi:hypothetical protein